MSDYDTEDIRDVHALTPSFSPHNSSPSMTTSDRGFSNMSVTNSTLVVAGSPISTTTVENDRSGNWDVGINGFRTNSLSSVLGDNGSVVTGNHGREVVVTSASSFKKEEVESKITAWKNAKVAEINNRFKCEDAIINGWESEQAQQSALRLKKVERKLEEKRVRALEKMENEIAKAHHKAEERRATAEGKRGTKIARVVEVANLMKAVGRAPVKNSFF